MSVVNLTRPIREGSAAGRVLPWETPYRTEPIATLERNGANLFFIEMSPSASTRLVGGRIADASRPSTRDVDPGIILNRAATTVSLPAQVGESITAEALRAAVQAAAPRQGDALLLVTGWGDREHDSFSDAYVLDAPALDADAVASLTEIARQGGHSLILTDLPYLAGPGGATVREEWVSAEPWHRPSWPSASAKAYLDHYGPSKVAADWGPLFALLEVSWLVLGLSGCAQVAPGRSIVSVAPLQVDDAGEAPCTVVAWADGSEERSTHTAHQGG